MNETFRFSSRDEARAAAYAGGWEMDDIQVSTTGPRSWGWTLFDEYGLEATLEAPPHKRRKDAPALSAQPLVDETEADVSGAESPAPDDDEPTSVAEQDEIEPEIREEAAVEDPAVPEQPASALADAPTAVEQTVILQINGPMLPAAAKLRALHFAKQLGLEITLRDASTMAALEVVRAVARGKAGRSNANDLIIEMCTRPEGATATELAKAAKERGCTISKVQDQITKIAEEHGLDMNFEAVFRHPSKPPVIAYFLRHPDVEGQAIAAD